MSDDIKRLLTMTGPKVDADKKAAAISKIVSSTAAQRNGEQVAESGAVAGSPLPEPVLSKVEGVGRTDSSEKGNSAAIGTPDQGTRPSARLSSRPQRWKGNQVMTKKTNPRRRYALMGSVALFVATAVVGTGVLISDQQPNDFQLTSNELETPQKLYTAQDVLRLEQQLAELKSARLHPVGAEEHKAKIQNLEMQLEEARTQIRIAAVEGLMPATPLMEQPASSGNVVLSGKIDGDFKHARIRNAER